MATRTVNFTWDLNSNPSDPTYSINLNVKDSSGNIVLNQTITPATQQSNWSTSLQVGTGYTVKLTAFDVSGNTDPTPPTLIFDVPPSPPPPAPNDPILNPPTIS